MAYTYRIIAAKSKKYLTLDTSQLNNIYIDNVSRGENVQNQQNTYSWTSYNNPRATNGVYSAPIKLYNTLTHRFLASTEQIQTISGTTNKVGEILGTTTYGTADNALEFVFMYVSDNKYLIWLSGDEKTPQTGRTLLYDKLNKNRVVLTAYNPPAVTSDLDNIWSIEQVAL